ncbi:MAG: efflux RND transporter periplasmic adaptor subunit [Bacteroidaceae bacterium]|nr:efflux RND transporter periplasmic adaptor subunit [Bacteroidaceae bacterium]MBR5455991.1 efflux RND transporter periplasmic adaptor subunit [Bacteroidaceae bacterium]
MDIKLEKKKGWRAVARKKNLPYLFAAVLVVLVAWLLLKENTSTLRVNTATLMVSSVEEGEFNDYVSLSGTVQPITTMQLSPLESGVVERIVAEEGTAVKAGDVILEMTNKLLSMQILQSEADLAEKQNILRNTLISMEQERLSLRQEMLQLDLDVTRKKRAYMQNESLFSKELVSKETYLQSKEDYELAVNRRSLVRERQKQDSLYRTVQVAQLDENLRSMQLNMQLIRERVGNLSIKAPIDGEVGMLNVVLGQTLSQGSGIGQINDLSAYKVTAMVDEHYIDRVVTGLTASFMRQDNNYDMMLRKIYPEVRDGKFKVDLTFDGELPDNIRSGQTYNLNLQLGQPVEAVYIPRGAFFQKTGGRWIYVVDETGEKAYRRDIRIGRQNPRFYEVIDGLAKGEMVITSSYDNFGDNEVLILKKD